MKSVLSLTIVLIATLFQYLQKDLILYQNFMLTTLDYPVNTCFLFQAIILQDLEKKSVICSATLIWNLLQNKYSNQDFIKLAPKALKNFLTQKLISLICE